MSQTIKLDIISDVVCPWCIVGYKRLDAAIKNLGIEDKVEVEWHPFELNPDMPAEGEDLRQHVARKYGASRADSDAARQNISQLGAEYGFEFNYFDAMKMVNTMDAHVLLDYARLESKQTELKLRLFHAFFSEQKDVSDRNVLLAEVEAVGLDPKSAQAHLDNPHIRQQIREQEAQWQELGISGVPTVIFNQTSAVTGAYPQRDYEQVLKDLIQSA